MSRSPAPTSMTERVFTVLALIGLGLVSFAAAFLGLFLVMSSDCTGDTPCNDDQIWVGTAIAVASPVVVFLVALVVVLRRIQLRRPAWWVPLVAFAVGTLAWILGAIIAGSAAID